MKALDDEVFEVDEVEAFQSQTIKNIIEDTGKDEVILLPNVSSKILALVIEYCKYHISKWSPIKEEVVNNWHVEFVKVEQQTLFDLIMAANYLNGKDLLDLACQTVADMIKVKTPNEI